MISRINQHFLSAGEQEQKEKGTEDVKDAEGRCQRQTSRDTGERVRREREVEE